jgi:ribosomal protein L7/L12
MSEFTATLHGVDTNNAIQAIKTLRVVSGGGLRWAKMDVYDKVKMGHAISVPIHDAADIAELENAGWTATMDGAGVVAFSARVPAAKYEDIASIVRALGGVV